MDSLKNSFEFGYLYAHFLPILASKDTLSDGENFMLNRFFLHGNNLGLEWEKKEDITYEKISTSSFHHKVNEIFNVSNNSKSHSSWMLGQLIGSLESTLKLKSKYLEHTDVKSAISTYQKGITEFLGKLGIEYLQNKNFEDIKRELKNMDNKRSVTYNIGDIDASNIQIGESNSMDISILNSMTMIEVKNKIEKSDLSTKEKQNLLDKVNSIITHPLFKGLS